MAFSPPGVGCLVKKTLAKGRPRAPQEGPPGYALVSVRYSEEKSLSGEVSKIGERRIEISRVR